jgi:hypothetical protein
LSTKTTGAFRQQALDKLSSPEDLNELLTVTSPRSWLLLGAIGLMLVAAVVWGLIATIETTIPGTGILVSRNGSDAELQAVLYVSIADGKRVQPGMIARISPSTVRSEEFGMVLGTVTAVQQVPSTQAEMFVVLGNDALVQSLAATGAIVEVRLALQQDPTTASGYDWTSAGGPPARLWGGVLSDAYIVVNEQRPIELVLAR